MKKTTLFSAAVITALSGSAFAVNIAGTGTGILGIHTTIDATLGTPYFRTDQGGAALINNNDTTAFVDTWSDGASSGGNAATLAGTHSYVGITGLTIPAGEQITSVTLTGNNFPDGGWFGTNADLSTANAVAPTVQVSSDGGTTWTTIAATEDYVNETNAVGVGGGATTSTFTFAGQTGVDSIRLIGTHGGGPAGADPNGFLGVRELVVDTTAIPEPGSSALLGLAGLAMILRRRK